MNALPDTYHDVDAASDPSQLIDYLDRLADSATGRAYKRATYDLLQLSDAGAVLDVGCGTGDDARAIAMLAGPHTRGSSASTSVPA